MNLLSMGKECVERILSRKKLLVAFAIGYFVFAILGVCFIRTPAIYEYHFNLCDRFVANVCYSTKNVLLIFFERMAGNIIILAIFCLCSVHPVALLLPSALFIYRAYTFGGCLYVFFTVYKLSGVLIVFVLYLPVRLLIDTLLLGAISCACSRAFEFQFRKEDWISVGKDFCIVGTLVILVCLIEIALLFCLFHPIGNLL